MAGFSNVIRTLAGAAILTLAGNQAVPAARIYLAPPESTISFVGATGTFEGMIEDLTGNEDVGAFDRNVSSDHEMPALSSYVPRDEPGTVGIEASDMRMVSATPGSINSAATSFFPDPVVDLTGQPALFKPASVTLRGISTGKRALTDSGIVGNGWCFPIAFTGRGTTAAVPQPVLPSMLIAEILLVPLIRRKKREEPRP